MKDEKICRKAWWLVGLAVGVILVACIVVLCCWNWIFGNSDVESAVYRQLGGELSCGVRCSGKHSIKKVSSKPGVVKDVWVVAVETDGCLYRRTITTGEYSFVNGHLTLLRWLGQEH